MRTGSEPIRIHRGDARVSAAIALLDRGYGKPPQFCTNDAGSFKRAVEMSDDELAAIAARAKLTVV